MNIFLVHFRFLEKLQIFLLLLGIMHAAPPTKISTDILLTAAKTFGLKISVAFFTKLFQFIFTVGGWRMYPFNLPLLAPAYIPRQSCTRASFWSLNPARARNHSPNPARARFRPESQIYRASYDMRYCGITKHIVCGCSCRYTVYRTQNTNHLEQNIGIIWHRHSMLAVILQNIMFLKKKTKLFTMAL